MPDHPSLIGFIKAKKSLFLQDIRQMKREAILEYLCRGKTYIYKITYLGLRLEINLQKRKSVMFLRILPESKGHGPVLKAEWSKQGQALVKNPKRPLDFRFSNGHSPNQDLIALDFQNAAVPLQSFTKYKY